MVCSCAMPSNCVWLQIIFCTCVKETVLFSFLWSLLRENGRSLRFPRIFIKKKQTRWSNEKQLLNSVIAKYCDLSVSRRSIICLSLRLRQIIGLRDTDNSITEFVLLMNILEKRSDLPFWHKSDRKKEKSTVSFTHVQNITCSQTQLDGIAHEQTIICRQLFAGHVVGSRPMKGKKNLLRKIIRIMIHW